MLNGAVKHAFGVSCRQRQIACDAQDTLKLQSLFCPKLSLSKIAALRVSEVAF
jgi:hypothetical protein